MKKMLLTMFTTILSLGLITGCGTTNDNDPIDEDVPLDQRENDRDVRDDTDFEDDLEREENTNLEDDLNDDRLDDNNS